MMKLLSYLLSLLLVTVEGLCNYVCSLRHVEKIILTNGIDISVGSIPIETGIATEIDSHAANHPDDARCFY